LEDIFINKAPSSPLVSIIIPVYNGQLFIRDAYQLLIDQNLDDFEIIFEGKKSKIYASRGQQKLVVLLIKIAQMKLLTQYSGPGIFLLDDFLTDFDLSKMHILLSILVALDCQLIFTSPSKNSPIEQFLAARNDQYRVISI